MNAGRIEQCDTPEAVYQRPRSTFVADFVGEANLTTCRVDALEGEIVRVRNHAGETFLARRHGDRPVTAGDEVRLVVRPENIEIGASGGIHGTVDEVVFSGATAKVTVALADGSRLAASVPAGRALPGKGAPVMLSWSPDSAVIAV
jgi:ABC-type Fe3+/spermidine/putrescine transport system ATPase subunit